MYAPLRNGATDQGPGEPPRLIGLITRLEHAGSGSRRRHRLGGRGMGRRCLIGLARSRSSTLMSGSGRSRVIGRRFRPPAIESTPLPGAPHGDPADRILMATARHLGGQLATCDREILSYSADGQLKVRKQLVVLASSARFHPTSLTRP